MIPTKAGKKKEEKLKKKKNLLHKGTELFFKAQKSNEKEYIYF